MTQEDKQLLLKDLCARLPYGVKVQFSLPNYNTNCFDDEIGEVFEIGGLFTHVHCKGIDYLPNTNRIKPYLRPMSSMTEEEKMQLKEEQLKDTRLFAEALTKAAGGDTSMRGKVIPHFAADWCNKNHFDFRGLIPMGLALEAPKNMYNNE